MSERLSDAVVESGDDAAVGVLLANPTAQIREDTLDRLIEAAPAKTQWHEPLVRRPKLSARHIERLSEFVASALVEQLANRADIDPEQSAHLKKLVAERLDTQSAGSVATSCWKSAIRPWT